MKIDNLPLSRLRSEEHFRYQTEFKALVDAKTPATLGIATDYPLYTTCYTNEGAALNVLVKSKISDDLLLLDETRDNTYRGISDSIYASVKHFKQANQDAAKRLVVLLERYGKVADKPYEQETASIASFLADTQATPFSTDSQAIAFTADIATLGLTEWVAKLKTDNDAFVTQLKARDAENAAKPQVDVRNARILLDQSYKTLVDRINALIIVNGDTNYKTFVLELNEIITRFHDLIAQRQGRNEKKAAKAKEAAQQTNGTAAQ